MTAQDDLGRQIRLLSIIRSDFKDDIDAVVTALAQASGQKVTARTVQAWRVAPGKVSHRRVPEWALKALEDHARQSGNDLQVAELANRTQERPPLTESAYAWSDNVRRNHAVEYATHGIERDAELVRSLREAAGKFLGGELAKIFIEIKRDIAGLSDAQDAIDRAIKESSDIHELKRRYSEVLGANRLTKFHVRTARRAIETGAEEFSNDEQGSDVRQDAG